jgi:pimeloyl-ACP methyl ester carboxylesterase
MIVSIIFYTLLLIFGLFLLVILISSLFNAIITPLWLRMPSPEGKMITSVENKLFVRIKGEGNPIIVFETWSGGPSFEWWQIQDELAKHCRVVTYDRAGYGWSEQGEFPRTSEQIATELKTMLENANITGPYVLVGHSLGALYINHFARKYPDHTQAVIMIDPFSPENQRWYDEFPDYLMYYDKTKSVKTGKTFALLGLMRMFRFVPYLNVPKKIKRYVISHYSSLRAYRAIMNELQNWPVSVEQINNLPSFPDVPLKILFPASESTIKSWMAYKIPEPLARQMEQLHEDLVKNMMTYSSKSELIDIPDTSHAIHLDQPNLVAEKIIQTIYQLRSQDNES